jgi:hypothetical protein
MDDIGMRLYTDSERPFVVIHSYFSLSGATPYSEQIQGEIAA